MKTSGTPMRETSNRSLFDYWNTLRGARKAPKRSELEPSQFSSLLSHTFVLEDNLPTVLSFRLAGSHLCRAHDKQLRGTDFRELFHQDDHHIVARDLLSVRGTGLAGTLQISSPATASRKKESELILLPLADAGDQIVQYLGSWCPAAVGYPQTSNRHSLHRILRIYFRPPGHIAGSGSHARNPFPPNNQISTEHGRFVISKHRRFRILDGGRSLID